MPGQRAFIASLLALAGALPGASARAQSVQITPFAGYAFGGSVRDAVLDEKRSFDPALAYGGAISFPVSEGWRFELLYSRQPTRLEGGLGTSFDVTIERYLAGIQEEKGAGEQVRWFGSAWLGATRFVPGLGGYDSETKFGGGVGLGVKTFLSRNVGLRFEGRAFYTRVKGEGGMACVNGSCLFVFSGSGLWQGDVSAGLILAF
jgi:opacity protein-like surface antigen